MGAFPSGQRGQTVNLLSTTSVVRIHPLPPKNGDPVRGCRFLFTGFHSAGGEVRAEAPAFPEKRVEYRGRRRRGKEKDTRPDVLPGESCLKTRTYVLVSAFMIPRRGPSVKRQRRGFSKISRSKVRTIGLFFGEEEKTAPASAGAADGWAQKYCLMPSGARSGSSLMVMVNLMPFFSPKLLSQLRKFSTSL